jgi:uncharacterized protein YaaR (DUF327 family)
MSDLDHHRHEL